MARGKKAAKELTAEEKLEQALVPENKQPYKIPENWCWTMLKDTAEIIMGQSPAGTATTDDDSYMPLIGGAADMGDLYPKATRYTKIPTKISCKDDLILCIRATLGRPIFSDGEYCLGRGVAGIRPYQGKKEFFRLFFINFEHYLYENATGTTFAQVSRAILQDMPIPLPPLAEQQRIVDRIENIFAKLDEAKEKAQAVVDGFELRKSAILHKAFTGELTKQWRQEHGVDFASWYKTTLGELTDIVSSKRIYKEEYVEDGIPFFRSSEIVDLHDFGFTKPVYFIKEERYMQIKEQYGLPQKGDLLVTSVGTIGKTWIVDDRKFYYKDGNLTQVKQCQKLDMKFLQYYIMSSEFNCQVNDTVAGSAYNALTIVKFKKIGLLLPVIDEQWEIVQILNNLLEKEQQAKEAAESVIDQIDTMKKAVLARAFRGELGTNDPAEESAVELLKGIL